MVGPGDIPTGWKWVVEAPNGKGDIEGTKRVSCVVKNRSRYRPVMTPVINMS